VGVNSLEREGSGVHPLGVTRVPRVNLWELILTKPPHHPCAAADEVLLGSTCYECACCCTAAHCAGSIGC
jgi:hypothetical protein